jgi:NADP-dependent 3-hydroxy acid dehydrogenase YdfG
VTSKIIRITGASSGFGRLAAEAPAQSKSTYLGYGRHTECSVNGLTS